MRVLVAGVMGSYEGIWKRIANRLRARQIHLILESDNHEDTSNKFRK